MAGRSTSRLRRAKQSHFVFAPANSSLLARRHWSASQVQSGRHLLASLGALVVDLHGPRRRHADCFDTSLLQAGKRLLRYIHESVGPLPYDDNVWGSLQHIGKITRLESVALFTPPVTPHPRRQDDNVAIIRTAVYLDVAEAIGIDARLSVHYLAPYPIPPLPAVCCVKPGLPDEDGRTISPTS